VGCAAITAYGDKVGRKKTIWICLFFLILGSALQTGKLSFSSESGKGMELTGLLGSVNIAMYQVSRVITGFGSGALFSTVPVYQYVN